MKRQQVNTYDSHDHQSGRSNRHRTSDRHRRSDRTTRNEDDNLPKQYRARDDSDDNSSSADSYKTNMTSRRKDRRTPDENRSERRHHSRSSSKGRSTTKRRQPSPKLSRASINTAIRSDDGLSCISNTSGNHSDEDLPDAVVVSPSVPTTLAYDTHVETIKVAASATSPLSSDLESGELI